MIEYRHEQGIELLRFFGELRAKAQAKATAMFSNHWDEVATSKNLFILDPDYERYRKFIEANSMVIVTARDDDNLIGYISLILYRHLHYRQVLVSLEDIHYMDPEYRKRGLGSGMIKKAEDVLRGRGVKFATMRTKVHADHGDLLKELGYSPMETVYGKEL